MITGKNLMIRFLNLKEDGGSGRLFIYSELLKLYKNSTLFEMVFGHGYQSTNKYIGILAHNDTLQILFDFGFIGFLLYSLFLFYLIKLAVVKHKNKEIFRTEYAVYVASLISFLVLTQSNCLIYSPYILSPMTLLIGILYFRLKYPKNEKTIFN